MSKYFKKMPSGYTENYFYEFSKGCVTFRRLGTTPNEEATTLQLARNIPELRERILRDLFTRSDDLMKLTMADVVLPTHPGRPIKKSRIKSLAAKYFSIPEKYLQYYPPAPFPEKSKVDKINKWKGKKRPLTSGTR